MGSSNPNKIFDPVRQTAFAARPEELVRQELVRHLIFRLGYPKHTLLLEKELKQLPHLSNSLTPLPDRRADLICLAKGIHVSYPLYPLLLVECKEDQIDQTTIDQLIGYNHFVRAYFIAAVGRQETQFAYFDAVKEAYVFHSQIPKYEELLKAVHVAD